MSIPATPLEFIAITDSTGADRELPRHPRRIVSLAPGITHTLFHLGLSDEVVAVTRQCSVPKDRAKSVEKLGGGRELDHARIVDLDPDLVLVDLDQSEPEAVQGLEDRVPVYALRAASVEEAISRIETLGILVDREEEAAALATEIRAEVDESRAWARGRTLVRTACLVARDPYRALGSGTYAADFLALHGLDNVFATSGEPYPEIDDGMLVAAVPGLVLLPSEPFRFRAKHRDEILALADLPAAKDDRVRLVEGTPIFSHGARMRTAFAYMREFLDEALATGEGGAQG